MALKGFTFTYFSNEVYSVYPRRLKGIPWPSPNLYNFISHYSLSLATLKDLFSKHACSLPLLVFFSPPWIPFLPISFCSSSPYKGLLLEVFTKPPLVRGGSSVFLTPIPQFSLYFFPPQGKGIRGLILYFLLQLFMHKYLGSFSSLQIFLKADNSGGFITGSSDWLGAASQWRERLRTPLFSQVYFWP